VGFKNQVKGWVRRVQDGMRRVQDGSIANAYEWGLTEYSGFYDAIFHSKERIFLEKVRWHDFLGAKSMKNE
jgi:hypothetical protein